MTYNCKICGEQDCKKHYPLIYKRFDNSEFSGSSPPDIFIGRWNYPNVNLGIISPIEIGNTKRMASHEIWHSENLQIPEINRLKSQLIYTRSPGNIFKALNKKDKIMEGIQEIAMSKKSVSAEFKIKNKNIIKNQEKESFVPLVNNTVSLETLRLQENTKISSKIDYLVNDTEVKSKTAIIELEKSNIETSTIMKILSAGLLGLKQNRKLVPTRWSITAIDDTLSKEKLKKIRLYNHLGEIHIFSSYYLGNNYHFILIPGFWEFEVVEISMKNFKSWQDYESFFPRKKYAESVTGAYYANRLAVTEYLSKIKKQCKCIVLREIRPEYYSPLGVGILRETSRKAFSNKPKKFENINQTLNWINQNLRIPIKYFKEKSIILNRKEEQKTLFNF